jgi:hypothetical protein
VSPVRYELGFHIPEDGILHSHSREALKSYTALTGWALQRRSIVSPVRYELGFYIPEDGILHSRCRETLISYMVSMLLISFMLVLQYLNSIAIKLSNISVKKIYLYFIIVRGLKFCPRKQSIAMWFCTTSPKENHCLEQSLCLSIRVTGDASSPLLKATCACSGSAFIIRTFVSGSWLQRKSLAQLPQFLTRTSGNNSELRRASQSAGWSHCDHCLLWFITRSASICTLLTNDIHAMTV